MRNTNARKEKCKAQPEQSLLAGHLRRLGILVLLLQLAPRLDEQASFDGWKQASGNLETKKPGLGNVTD